MKKKELLEIIKKDDGFALEDWLREKKGDYNLKISRKPLIEHAIIHKADHCTNILLLYGAHSPKIRELITDHQFLEMVEEIEFDIIQGKRQSTKMVERILDELSKNILGHHPFSNRNTLLYDLEADKRQIYCGLHYFEYEQWDFLKKHIRAAFQCELRPWGKYAMVVSAIKKNDLEEIPMLSERITSFVRFQEIPFAQLANVLETMLKNENEILIGIHYSESQIFVGTDSDLDLPSHFFNSMNDVIGQFLGPTEVIIKSNRVIFRNMTEWDHELNRSVERFKKKHGMYPNILMASTATYNRIDMVANTNHKDQIRNPEGNSPENFSSMGGFRGNGYELDFCIDETLTLNSARLVYDSDPGGGGEPVFDWDEYLGAVAG